MSEAELPKTYDPAAVEAQAYQTWLDEKCFEADPNKPGNPYCIVIPPPNVTGALHLGHAINNTLQDILTRMHRMAGFNTLWVPGIDHAGIATQAVVEKQLKEKENKTRHDVGREGLVERIWTWKQQYGDRILEQLKRLGCSCDWSRTRFTLDDMCAKAVRETFFKLFKDGLIYRGKRLVNWDVHLQTSISDDEIYHETVKTNLWHIRYPIVDAPTTGTAEPLVKHVEILETDADLESFSADPDSQLHLSDETPEGDVALLPLPPGEGRGEGDLTAEHAESAEKDKNEFSASSAVSAVQSPLARPKFMTVATTRPETLLGDTAVAVHSQDPRWNWAIGKFVKLPLTNRLIPIIADDILVDPKFGSGVVKVTPAHDPNDYAVWQRQAGKIEILNILNANGTLNENAGPYAGMKRDPARKKVVEDLTAQGLLEKEEPYETQVGHSDRSKTPVEPYLSDQWFVKMAPLAEPALEVVRDGTIKFFPERHAQQYLSWLGEKRDWPISRQLWWGHRIPVWSGETKYDVNHPQAATEDHMAAYEQEFSRAVERFAKETRTDSKIAVSFSREKYFGPVRFHLALLDQNAEAAIDLFSAFQRTHGPMQARTPEPQPAPTVRFPSTSVADAAEHLHKYIRFIEGQDPDVLDTWFSSALWPHSTLGWPEQTADLAKWYPTSVLMTGRDIITLWVARMVMMGMYNMSETPPPLPPGEGRGEGRRGESSPATEGDSNLSPHPNPLPEGEGTRERATQLGIPFRHVAINPTILDGKGERMSKSKGNGVDPVDIIDTHGADALRFTLTSMATETQDVRLPIKKLPDGRNTSDRFDIGRNFCNKLWNAARFTLSSLQNLTAETAEKNKNEFSALSAVQLSLPDRWIISRFNHTVEEANAALAVYRFDQYAKTCYDFFWRDFCDWYVETIKPALKDPQRAAQTADILANVLDGALRLMHPMIPFITETIWWRLNAVRPQRGIGASSKRLILAPWPPPGPIDSAVEQTFSTLQEIIIAIRNVRNEHKADPKKSVTVSIAAASDLTKQSIESNREIIELLASCTIGRIGTEMPPPVSAIRTIAGGCEIFIEGLANLQADVDVTAKQCEALKQKAAVLRSRLSNESYAAKAPAHLVQQTRDELAAAVAEMAKLGCRADD